MVLAEYDVSNPMLPSATGRTYTIPHTELVYDGLVFAGGAVYYRDAGGSRSQADDMLVSVQFCK